ncbi:sialate O-acetylesterase [Flavisolibacter sp. BT320]|nr:sialate O-acetylesterase [Flavisolibacter longurius]
MRQQASLNRHAVAAVCILFVCLLPVTASTQIKLAPIFSDNMVLQRNEPVHVWGKATPGTKLQVQFAWQTKSVIAAKDSTWKISFPSQKSNQQPQTIRIQAGNETILLENILIGDVWLLSGQSNMEWPMAREKHWATEKKWAQQPLIRLNNPPPAGRSVYGVAYTDSLNRRLTKDSFYLWNGWTLCDSNTVKSMSAVGYYFAKSIVENENIPIGLINLSIGGAPLETFVSREALQNSKQFSAKAKGDWLQNKNLPEWIRERGAQNVGNHPGGYRDDLGLNHAYKPGFAYASGVAPLLSFPIKGVLWYQGESNSLEKERVDEYKDLLHLLIRDYRKGWKKPALPFYWVQLSSIDTANYGSHFWPQFRDAQRQLLAAVKNGGMAVSSDVGFKNDVHPTNKKVVGERLARWALNQVYGKDLVPSGPLPREAVYRNGKVMIRFQYADSLRTSDGKPVRGFSLDGKTGAEARIENNEVVILAGSKPDFVYYAWKPFTNANLVNEDDLPASTFQLKITEQ